MRNMAIKLLAILALLLLLTVIIEALVIRFNGGVVSVPEIPRGIHEYGSEGSGLTYVVMGDSTAVSQGSDYEDGYAVNSALHLSNTYKVKFANFGVSGARAKDVLTDQVGQAIKLNPDLVLISVGANDVTHLTNLAAFNKDMEDIIDKLKAANPDVGIVLTGSPDMSAIDRFPFFVSKLAGFRTRQINSIFDDIFLKYQVVSAPIAKETGFAFASNSKLYSVDKFHPNADGYALWTPVINAALDKALNR